MELDLVHDKAKIVGKEVPLHNTSSGQYIVSMKETLIPIQQSLFISQEIKKKEKMVIKPHKQFAHPSAKRLKTLLEDAGVYDNDCQKVLDKLQETCDVCLKFKRTPSRPVVSIPLATNFNEVMVMDLKELVKGKIWFLHLIDAATCFSLAAVIYNKHAATVINKVMLPWIASGFGAPGMFLADNGSEYETEESRDMYENLNIQVQNTTA